MFELFSLGWIKQKNTLKKLVDMMFSPLFVPNSSLKTMTDSQAKGASSANINHKQKREKEKMSAVWLLQHLTLWPTMLAQPTIFSERSF